MARSAFFDGDFLGVWFTGWQELFEAAERLGEAQMLDLSCESDHIAVHAAAKAIKCSRGGIDGERRILIFMKRAGADEIGACLVECYVVPNDSGNGILLLHSINSVSQR